MMATYGTAKIEPFPVVDRAQMSGDHGHTEWEQH